MTKCYICGENCVHSVPCPKPPNAKHDTQSLEELERRVRDVESFGSFVVAVAVVGAILVLALAAWLGSMLYG